MRDELNRKTYDLQKEVKNLDERCKRYKEEIERLKAKNQITEQDLGFTTLKTVNSTKKMKETMISDEKDI